MAWVSDVSREGEGKDSELHTRLHNISTLYQNQCNRFIQNKCGKKQHNFNFRAFITLNVSNLNRHHSQYLFTQPFSALIFPLSFFQSLQQFPAVFSELF